MSLHDDVHARLVRVRTLWAELNRTRPTSQKYKVLVDEIRTASLAYLALIEGRTDVGLSPTRQTDARSEDDRGPTILRQHGIRDLAPDIPHPATSVSSPPSGMHTRLERIKKLWLELEDTPRTSARYEVLIEQIHAESLASPEVSMGGTILMVDDEEPVRRMTGRALRLKEFTVLEAATPEIALEIFEADTGNIRLLLTDVVMPGMTGPRLAQHLIGKRPDLRVVFMSGYTARLEAIERGVSDRVRLLPKPFEMASLFRAVTELLTLPSSDSPP